MKKRLVRIANAVLDLDPYPAARSTSRSQEIEPEVLKLDGSESILGSSPAAKEAVKAFPDNHPLNWYPDPDALKLRDKLSDYVSLPSDHISCFAGAHAAIEGIVRTYLEPGTEIMIGAPIFSNILRAARSTGARVIEAYNPDPFAPSIEMFVDYIGSRTRLLYIGNPSDPTGAMFTEAELVFLLAYAERTMIVIDETYFEFSGLTAADLIGRFSNLSIVRTFSKGFGLAALRTGYILSDPENLEFIRRVSGENGPDGAAQIAACAALENLDYTRGCVKAVDEAKRIIADSLPEIGYEFRITPANFFLLRVSNASEAADCLAENGILVRDLSNVKQLSGFLRITIGTPEQADRLLLVLSRMAERFATGYNRNRFVIEPARSDKKIADQVPAE